MKSKELLACILFCAGVLAIGTGGMCLAQNRGNDIIALLIMVFAGSSCVFGIGMLIGACVILNQPNRE